jgi:hypothetical protein
MFTYRLSAEGIWAGYSEPQTGCYWPFTIKLSFLKKDYFICV